IGIVAGIVMLRSGILATLIWHYTVDASLVGLALIRSDNLYFKISGVVVGLAAVAPLAWSGISYLLRGSFEAVEDLLNGAEAPLEIDLTPQPASEETGALARRYNGLTASNWISGVMRSGWRVAGLARQARNHWGLPEALDGQPHGGHEGRRGAS